MFIGTSVDPHLDAVATEVSDRGLKVSTVHVDVDFAGGLNLGLRPPATVAADAVLVRSIDLRLPVPHHGQRQFVEVDPFDRGSPTYAFAHREAAAAAQCWLDLMDAKRWVNEPWAARRADSKALQLRSAARHGLATPRTLMTADVAEVVAFAEDCGGTVVHKGLQHPMSWHDAGAAGFLHTSKVSVEELRRHLPALPTMALFQERLKPTAEYRATVVGNRVFTARIAVVDPNEPDRRRELFGGHQKLSAWTLEPHIADQLVALVSGLGLAFGSADLLETADGTIHFLELNPTGSYLWIERAVGLPITAALADQLLAVHPSNAPR